MHLRFQFSFGFGEKNIPTHYPKVYCTWAFASPPPPPGPGNKISPLFQCNLQVRSRVHNSHRNKSTIRITSMEGRWMDTDVRTNERALTQSGKVRC